VVLVGAEEDAGLLVPFGDVGESAAYAGADLEGLSGGVEVDLEGVDERVVEARVAAGRAGAVGGHPQHAGGGEQVDQARLVLVAVLVRLDADEAGALAVLVEDPARVGVEVEMEGERRE